MEDEMVGWHQQLDGHEFEALGVGDGQGSLGCCSPWGHKECVCVCDQTVLNSKSDIFCLGSSKQKPNITGLGKTLVHRLLTSLYVLVLCNSLF